MNTQGREGTGSDLPFKKITLQREWRFLGAKSKQEAQVEDSDMVLVWWGTIQRRNKRDRERGTESR